MEKKDPKLCGYQSRVFDPKQLVYSLHRIAKNLQVVLNSSLGEQPLIIGEQQPRLGGGVRRVNQTGRMGVAQCRFKILPLVVEYPLNSFLEEILLGADFRTQREQGATQHAAALRLNLRLYLIAIIAILPNPFQRGNRRRKERVELGAPAGPFLADGG